MPKPPPKVASPDTIPCDSKRSDIDHAQSTAASAEHGPLQDKVASKLDSSSDDSAHNLAGPGSISSQGIVLSPSESITPHPVAARFRRTSEHRQKLAASLKAAGQLSAATVYREVDGTLTLLDGVTRLDILRGMNRSLWCRFLDPHELGSRSLSDWILEMNFHGSEGRKLTDTQRALQITELAELIRDEAKKRAALGKTAAKEEKGKTHEHLAKIANCSPNRVKQAISVAKVANPALNDAVWRGEVSLSKAARVCGIEDVELRKQAIRALLSKDHEHLRRIFGMATRDALNQKVPASLAKYFNMAAVISKALSHLENANKVLEPHKELLVGHHITSLASLKEALLAEKPHSICEDCEGIGKDPSSGDLCKSCHGKRFLTEHEFNTVTAARQERLVRHR